jgi:mono/diheme cytochrome c family protein
MKKQLIFTAVPMLFLLASCGNNNSSNSNSASATPANFTPASSMAINEELAETGKNIFQSKCSSCHQMETRVVGPPMKGVTKIRSQEWLVDMIHKPEEMTKNDPIAKKLLAEYNGIQMTSMVNRDESEAIVEYLKLYDK